MCVSMLFGSLLIPRFAAALQKRKRKKNEKIRIQKYTEYINDCDKKIKEIMENYKEDKEGVVASIKKLIADGAYPANLSFPPGIL